MKFNNILLNDFIGAFKGKANNLTRYTIFDEIQDVPHIGFARLMYIPVKIRMAAKTKGKNGSCFLDARSENRAGKAVRFFWVRLLRIVCETRPEFVMSGLLRDRCFVVAQLFPNFFFHFLPNVLKWLTFCGSVTSVPARSTSKSIRKIESALRRMQVLRHIQYKYSVKRIEKRKKERERERDSETGDPGAMSYHRGGQAGAVAVSYSTSPMAPHSPSRRCSSGNSGNTSSTIGNSASKLSTYRSTASSSILDRPTNFYSSSSTSGSSGFRSNYTTEYRRSYCPSGSFYSSGASIRRSYVSEYSRSRTSPARCVCLRDDLYTVLQIFNSWPRAQTNEKGCSQYSHWLNICSSIRFGLSTSSSSSSISVGSSSSRDRALPESSSRLEIAADLIRYSPSGYVPNIRQTSSTGSSGNTNGAHHHHHHHHLHHHQWKHHSAGSSLTELFGGDDRDTAVERSTGRDHRPESSLSSSSSSSSCAVGGALWSRSKRRPLPSSTVLSSGHARADSAASPGEQQQRGAVHRTDEVSPAKRNLLSPMLGGGAGLIGVKLDLLTNLATNPSNGELLINNNVQKIIQGVEEEKEDVGIEDEAAKGGGEVIHSIDDTVTFIDAIAFLRGGRTGDPESLDDGEEQRNAPSSSYGIDQTGFVGGSTPPILQNGVAGRPSSTYGDDPSVPSTSRRPDSHFSGTIANTASNLTSSSPTAPSTAHQSLYRGVADQFRDQRFSKIKPCKLAYTQLLGWGLWCVWAVIALLLVYAFLLGIAAPLTPEKRVTCGVYSVRSNNSIVTARATLQPPASRTKEGSPTNKSARNRLQAHRDERCGLNGLRNIGNTGGKKSLSVAIIDEFYTFEFDGNCFMNSVIQCLSNTRPLLEYLLNEQYLADINTSTSSMKGALIKAFSQVIHELWEVGGDLVVNTTTLKSQIQRFAPRFMGYSQQDAQEFLRYLLEGLHEDVNRVTVKPQPIHTDIPEMYTFTKSQEKSELSLLIFRILFTYSQKAVESWKRYLRSEDSMIVDVFVGQLRSSLHCTSCDHVSVTLDPFWDLSLPIPARSGTVKLSQCLEHFTREEVLDGDEKPTCSKCQMRRKCTKSFSLDLSAFAAPRVPGCTYNLYGVANHSGTTHSGHYTAYCKHPYSGEWHEYNDSRVSIVSARSVVSNEAYVLFYEQQPHSSHL
ncbi:Ubiquitin carboxyl-terminal hydrolase 2 [Melipona quadrifasciata]|uniref:ubiquitinyl hydrolase 1 n=1 Tax=Melipona quadrifasciata TaxID=166423 RepID=A0A0M9A7S3_9HYME|nr:Ubiquitin carboxyl-terminal hydrolase 2 [Melipona quadrifasciata]